MRNNSDVFIEDQGKAESMLRASFSRIDASADCSGAGMGTATIIEGV
jgi:hypothetical protein